jgi:hypothetical protein
MLNGLYRILTRALPQDATLSFSCLKTTKSFEKLSPAILFSDTLQ